MSQLTPPRCRQCRYFYITWDKLHPYGCKAMGFKSKTLPWQVALAASAMPCQFFAVREQQEGQPTR
ncbi:MAG: uracil-DNA glycosylase [Sporomusaceae bacterium]|nr:uracil-DNA glycosylase [Sporomusaceae bacterium]